MCNPVVFLGVMSAVASLVAQGPATNSLRIIAASGQPVPGINGATFGGSGAFDRVAVDGDGVVVFRGGFTGGGATAFDDRALFRGRSTADLQALVRGGDAAPGIVGATLNSAAGQGISGDARIAENGSILFASALSGPGISAADDSALFGASPSAGPATLLVREGDPAPGTNGAHLAAQFDDMPPGSLVADGAGRLLFLSGTTGGDTSPGNDAGWFTGEPGALVLLQRRGDPVPGGAVVESLGESAQMNVHGQVLHHCILSTTTGNPAATAADDVVWMVFSPTGGDVVLMREGDPAPGTNGAIFGNPSDTWQPQPAVSTFNIFGQTVLVAELANGDTVPGVNDLGLFSGDPGYLHLTARRGDPAPGTTSTFEGFVARTAALNDYRRCTGTGVAGSCPEIAFTGLLIGGGATTADDTGIWLGSLAGMTLIVREGTVAPGTQGAEFADLSNAEILLNNRHQVVFHASLTGGDVGTNPGDEHALYAYDPYAGLQLVMRGGRLLAVGGAVIGQVAGFATYANGNGEGRSLAFGQDGTLAFTMAMTNGNEAVATVHVGSAQVTSYGAGCAGITGVAPSVFAVGLPELGNFGFALGITGGLPSSLGLIAIGYGPFNAPLSGCTILVTLPIVTLPTIFFDTTGTGTSPLPIPNNPALVGAVVYGQGIAIEAGGPFFGIAALSDAIAVEVGN